MKLNNNHSRMRIIKSHPAMGYYLIQVDICDLRFLTKILRLLNDKSTIIWAVTHFLLDEVRQTTHQLRIWHWIWQSRCQYLIIKSHPAMGYYLIQVDICDLRFLTWIMVVIAGLTRTTFWNWTYERSHIIHVAFRSFLYDYKCCLHY